MSESGPFNSQKGTKQEANGKPGLGIKQTHLLGHIADTEDIEQGQQETLEQRQDAGSLALADLTGIFAQRHVAPPMQPVFNGTITNDKFCMSRVKQMQWKPARAKRRDEIKYPSEGNETERFPQEDTHETTAMDGSALQHSNKRCSASLGSILPITRPLEHDLNGEPISKSHRGGRQE